MKLNRNLQGEALALHLERKWDYVRTGQKGSHIKLRTAEPRAHTVIIPAYKPVRIGTMFSIVRQAAGHKRVSTDELLKDA